ncbi:MAG: hypothetical protein R8J84_01005 [Mariprofundales bacterium]
MNTIHKTTPSKESLIILDALKTAVKNALERKRRLGQYAVIWKNGKPVCLGEDAPTETP